MVTRRPTCPSRSTRARRAGHGGFTLIELLAVLVILGILAGAAVPAMSALQGARAEAAARHCLADLSFARERAVATGLRTWVVFAPEAERWSMLTEREAQPGRAQAVALNDPGTGAPMQTELDSDPFPGIRIQSVSIDQETEVGFDWRGRPYNASESALASVGRVTLTGGHQITIEPETGHIAQVQP